MSALLESLLDPERRAAAHANDGLHAFGHGPSGAGYVDVLVTFPNVPLRSYRWPQVPTPRPGQQQEPHSQRARRQPSPSRFGDLAS